MKEWRIYKADFSIDPNLGVLVSCSYFVTQDVRDILKSLNSFFLQQLRNLEATEDIGHFVLVKLSDSESSLINNVFPIYEIKTIENDTPVVYFTNHLGWVKDLNVQEISSIKLKYSDVHIIYEGKE